MNDWTPQQTAAAQAASGAEWRRRAAEILGSHPPVLDRHDSTLCKLCGASIYDHGHNHGAAAPEDQEPPLSPDEEEMLF